LTYFTIICILAATYAISQEKNGEVEALLPYIPVLAPGSNILRNYTTVLCHAALRPV